MVAAVSLSALDGGFVGRGWRENASRIRSAMTAASPVSAARIVNPSRVTSVTKLPRR
jgi:hypothetical protein